MILLFLSLDFDADYKDSITPASSLENIDVTNNQVHY